MTTPSNGRIVAITIPEQWTAAVAEQTFLLIPTTMDLQSEQDQWFASGGDSSGKSFADFLKSRGAVDQQVEVWNIDYV